MDSSPYAAFLEGKIKDQHAYTHLLEEEVTALKERVSKLLKDIAVLRKSQNELRMRSRQAEERVVELQMELKRAKQIRNTKAKEATQSRERRTREQSQEGVDHKQIFRSYLDNTFPRNKGTIKKLLKAFFVLEEREGMQPLQKIKFYQAIFQGFVKRVLDWLFPKKTEAQRSQNIAQNLMKEWKEKGSLDKKSLDTSNAILLKEADYVGKIEKLEADMLMIRSSKSMVENRLKTYERGMQIKGGQFVVHLKKMLQEDKDIEPQSHQKIEEIMALFASASRPSEKKEEKVEQGPLVAQQVPLLLTDKPQNGHKRKAAPVLKKNIYGYYQDPQFAGNYTQAILTKHANPHKQTQTLPQDLCVLTLHPVILLTLIDGNIKPQRNRHSSQHYVRIKVNEEIQTESTMRESLEPVWNEPFLLKDYDFPFIHVSLMHKSKGLRDYAIGMGRLSASNQEQKIVNIRKDKQFQGRVRFSLSYPRGNIYQFKITSVKLEIPSEKIILKEDVLIKFPYNPQLSVQFVMPEQVAYLQRSMIILQSSEQSMSALLVKTALIGQLPLKEIIGQQGNKEVVVEIEGWKVIIQGELYLLICEEEAPEIISQELLEGGKGKYFSVRAPPPIVTVTYADILLHSSIKFPLVFALKEDMNRLTLIKQLSNRELVQESIEPILNREGCLRLSEFIKAPGKIYKFFIETIEGEEVRLRHESHLFQRLLKEIHLQVSYREDEGQEVDYARKHRSKKEQLYKEFTIESKELMLNHYKVFSRHFKRIGFVKFKLGYTIYDNELLYENVNEAPIKDSRRLEPIQQGTYFIQLQLSEAHLTSKSSSSAYRCLINGETSSQQKGNHPQWGQTFIVSFQFLEIFEVQVKYEVWEEGTFGKTKIYDGSFIINDKVMALGTVIISLGEKGEDCLHFSRITVPSSMIRLSIDEIEAQIKEEADWIGKIDPYITISSKNRQLIKTEYLDNKGSHPVWPNINKEIIISRPDSSVQTSQEDESFLQCRVYDYDLIGRDDYLGEVRITARLNPELMSAGQCEIMYGNLVKENLMCGSVRLKGSFERFTQQKVDFSLRKKPKLSKHDIVYRVSIFKVRMDAWKELKDDKGIASIKIGEILVNQQQFQFKQLALERFNLTHWLVNNQSLTIQFKRQYKSFFKTFTESLGSMTLQTSGRQLVVGSSSILNTKNQEIGMCHWYSEPQDKIKYVSFGNFTSCRQQITVRSDLEHQFSLNSLMNAIPQPYVFYHKNLTFISKTNEKVSELTFKDVGKDVYGLYLEHSDHSNMLGCFTADMTNSLQTKLQEKSERTKTDQSREYKQLTSIHWQPYQYQTTTAYDFILKFANAEAVTLRQQLQQVYNEYLVIKPFTIPVIFNADCLPNCVEIVNSRTRQVQVNLGLQEQTKIFVPNKGVLYCKIDDYNLKSIMELQFKHILIRFRDRSKFQNCPNARITLTSSLSLNTFTCELMPHTNSFLLQGLKLLIAEPPHSTTVFFFEAVVTDDQNRQIIKEKFGLRLQTNKQQYRIVDNSDYIVHALFSCVLIERNYLPPPQKDNTIYGMSFIELQEVEFEVNEDPSTRHIFLEVAISNQYLKVYLEKIEGSNLCKADFSSIFFIERSSIAEMTVIEEGVLSNSVLGTASVVLSETFITKEKVSINCQVRKDKKIIGRINIKYINLKEIPFIDVNMFSFISKANAAMIAQLQQFGPNKQKYQKIALTSRGDDLARLQSEDSFIVTKDPREYEITVNERDTNKLLGEFKLCHELQAVGDRITVLQPLRTSMSSLNGLLIIQYVSKQSNTVTWDQTKNQQTLLMELSISKLTLKKHNSRIGENFAIRLRTALRENKTSMMKIGKPSEESLATFTIYNNQPCEIAILDKTQLLGTINVSPPYCQGQERVIVLAKESKSIGICSFRVSYIKKQQQYGKMREISTIQAGNLIDAETFAKMTPYIELQSIGKHISYATELGLGKQKIFWKVNLMSSDALKLTVKDKDMFFDDLIGNALLDALSSQQLQDKTIELSLQNAEEGKMEGNGILKVTTSPTAAKFDLQSIASAGVKEVQCFMLQLGGLLDNSELLKTADSIEVYLGSGEVRVPLMKEFYEDVYFYLSNKDVELEFDSYFMGIGKDDFEININLCNRGNAIFQQKISSKRKSQAKDVFTIYNIIPLEKEFLYFQKVYLWMLEKIPSNLEVFLSSQSQLQRLRIVSYQKYLLVLQPYQLCSSIDPKHPLTIILRQGNETMLQVSFTINKDISQNRFISSGSILSPKSKEVGFYFAEMSRFTSKGQRLERKTMIGKSRRKWLSICINEATLTKDLETFSKMDPYCKFGPVDQRQSWRSTSVQDNIGLHPIWNESFFIELMEGQGQQFGFVVMDEQVTADRAVGEGRMSVTQLLTGGVKEIELFYKNNETSGNLRVETFLTASYIIFRDQWAPEACEFHLFHEANKIGEAGVKIELGVAYVIDSRKDIRIRARNSMKKLSFNELKEQQVNGIAFGEECACLHYDIYE